MDAHVAIWAKATENHEWKRVGRINGLEFWSLKLPSLRKSPYVWAVYDDGKPVKVEERFSHYLKRYTYQFNGTWMPLGEAYEVANVEEGVRKTSDTGERSGRTSGKTVTRRTANERQKILRKYIEDHADNHVFQGTAGEISEATGLNQEQVRIDLNKMIYDGSLNGRGYPGKGFKFVV